MALGGGADKREDPGRVAKLRDRVEIQGLTPFVRDRHSKDCVIQLFSDSTDCLKLLIAYYHTVLALCSYVVVYDSWD